jgi:hypothetical protein
VRPILIYRFAYIQPAPKAAWCYFISFPILSTSLFSKRSRQPKYFYFIADAEPFDSFVATNYPAGRDPISICVAVKATISTKPFTSAHTDALLRPVLSLSAPFDVCAHTLCCCFFARRKQRHTKLTGLGGGCLFCWS